MKRNRFGFINLFLLTISKLYFFRSLRCVFDFISTGNEQTQNELSWRYITFWTHAQISKRFHFSRNSKVFNFLVLSAVFAFESKLRHIYTRGQFFLCFLFTYAVCQNSHLLTYFWRFTRLIRFNFLVSPSVFIAIDRSSRRCKNRIWPSICL